MPCLNFAPCENFLNSYICRCRPGFTGRQCSQPSPIFLNQAVKIKDYSDTIAQIKITSEVFDSIKTLGDIVGVILPVAGCAFSMFSGIIGLISNTPSMEDVVFDFMNEQYKFMIEQFNSINNNLNLIYNKINDLNDNLALYYNKISEEILNLQVTLTAVSNMNKMNVYKSEANNLIIDLSVYLGLDIIYYPQIQQTCGQNYNPQHYLNIINQYANASIFDSNFASSYNLVYNIMIINNYADFEIYSSWYKQMFLLAYNLAYYGQICDSANNMSLVFQNQSTSLRTKTLSSIANGFTNQINELTSKTYYGKFIGCFMDNRDSRDLPKMPYKSENNMGVGFCIDYCQKYGYLYAGLQYGFVFYI